MANSQLATGRSNRQQHRHRSLPTDLFQFGSGSSSMDEPNNGGGAARSGPGVQHSKSFSTSYTYSDQPTSKDLRRTNTTSGSSSYSSSKNGRWSLSDPEVQRRKRIATYKVYAAEGKLKGSFRKSFRWIKDKCSLALW